MSQLLQVPSLLLKSGVASFSKVFSSLYINSFPCRKSILPVRIVSCIRLLSNRTYSWFPLSTLHTIHRPLGYPYIRSHRDLTLVLLCRPTVRHGTLLTEGSLWFECPARLMSSVPLSSGHCSDGGCQYPRIVPWVEGLGPLCDFQWMPVTPTLSL